MNLLGSAKLNGSSLELTDGGGEEAAAAWYQVEANIQSFTTDFTFQITPGTNPTADGFTFAIQGNNSTAVGPAGGGLGYGPDTPGGTGGIPNSVAVKFDLYSNDGEGTDSTGLYTSGASPTIPAVDMTSSGVNLHSGDPFHVHITYNGTALVMTITDTTTNATFTTNWTVDIPTIVGDVVAYVGFTAGTEGDTAVQNIQTWTFGPLTPVINLGTGFTTGAMTLNGAAKLNGTRLRVTDGGGGGAASAWYNTPVNIQKFTSNFSFQIPGGTNPTADGFAFVIQGGSSSALGSPGGGLGYGPGAPGWTTAAIPNSVAVKFDLYNNINEGSDSTGLYVDGASPTIPAVDMTSSGVNLHTTDVFNVQISYDGTNLTMTITDATTNATFTQAWPINIPTTVGGNTALVGFTGGTGQFTAIQEIIGWTLSSTTGAAAPVITSARTASGTVGSAFSYQITATNSPSSYGATGLPAGLSVNSGTGLISGTPTTAATSTVTLSASNSGGTGTATLTLTIATRRRR